MGSLGGGRFDDLYSYHFCCVYTVVNFLSKLMDSEERKEFYKEIRERVYELKIAHLFEEPCPLYEPDEDDEHY